MFFLRSLAEMIRTPRACGQRLRQPAARRYRSRPLTLEVLEARTVLSTYATGRLADPAAAEFMYWIDQGSNDIRRANLDGTGQQTVVAGLGSPIDIALDAAGGKMYWTDQV